MKILFCGYKDSILIDFIRSKGHLVDVTEDIIKSVEGIEFIISYGYRHIIRPWVIDAMKGNIINLHISFLPWNRGADPNFWSWVDGTPKGVTIHYVDEKLDTGPIIIQQYVDMCQGETLRTSYAILRKEIEKLFIDNFDRIINHSFKPQKQTEKGTYHRADDKREIVSLIGKDWLDIPVWSIQYIASQ